MQSKINIDNYEAFLLDLMEGNLSLEDLHLLREFAVLHPELGIDLEEEHHVHLEAENNLFKNKQYLKRNSSDLVSDDLLIAYVENTLTETERVHVEQSCKINTSLAKELDLYRSTILSYDTAVIFENKEGLKKKSRVIWFTPVFLRNAAALILLVGLIGLLLRKSSTENNAPKQIASKNSVPHQVDLSAGSDSLVSSNHLLAETKKNIKSSNTVNINAVSQRPSKKEENMTEEIKKEIPVNSTEISFNNLPDTSSNAVLAVNASSFNNSPVLANITEDDDAPDSPVKERKGFWSKARRTLNRLHNLGVKNVNGEEVNTSNTEQYVLSLGNFSIEKNRYAQ